MAAHKVLVCGSRYYTNVDRMFEVLDAYYARIGPRMMLIVGGAEGADEIARQWAVERKVDHQVYYAKWAIDGRSAGPIRNRRMLRKKPKQVLAFKIDEPGENRGTNHMVRIAREAGVKAKQFVDRKVPKKLG